MCVRCDDLVFGVECLFVFVFLFPQLFDALFNFLRLSHSDAFLHFSTSVEYLLYLRNLYKFVCSFLYIFRFLMSVRASLPRKYVCLHRVMLIVSPGFHVFHKFSISFDFRYN